MTYTDYHQIPMYLTVEQVADLLVVCPTVVYRMIRSGELPAITVGKQYRIAKNDLLEALSR